MASSMLVQHESESESSAPLPDETIPDAEAETEDGLQGGEGSDGLLNLFPVT